MNTFSAFYNFADLLIGILKDFGVFIASPPPEWFVDIIISPVVNGIVKVFPFGVGKVFSWALEIMQSWTEIPMGFTLFGLSLVIAIPVGIALWVLDLLK